MPTDVTPGQLPTAPSSTGDGMIHESEPSVKLFDTLVYLRRC